MLILTRNEQQQVLLNQDPLQVVQVFPQKLVFQFQDQLYALRQGLSCLIEVDSILCQITFIEYKSRIQATMGFKASHKLRILRAELLQHWQYRRYQKTLCC